MAIKDIVKVVVDDKIRVFDVRTGLSCLLSEDDTGDLIFFIFQFHYSSKLCGLCYE